MAGLVHRAYQGCLQERRPISHSSCFDVRYRGPPVPLHALRHAQPFELAVCGKAAAAAPPQWVAPPPHAHLISFGACESAWCESARLVCQKKGIDVTWHEEEEVWGPGGCTGYRVQNRLLLGSAVSTQIQLFAAHQVQ